LFESSPIAINEEDFSELFYYLDHLLDKGITDLNHYFNNNPDELKKCVFMIKITKMNHKSGDNYFKISGFRDIAGPHFFNNLTEDSVLMYITFQLNSLTV
jgi:hypothetical protein